MHFIVETTKTSKKMQEHSVASEIKFKKKQAVADDIEEANNNENGKIASELCTSSSSTASMSWNSGRFCVAGDNLNSKAFQEEKVYIFVNFI